MLDLEITRDLARDSWLSDADYDVLSNLSETEGHRVGLNDLAAQMLWSSSRLSHHITRMQKRSLVIRERDPSDARGTVIVLTESGWKENSASGPFTR